MTKDKPPRSAKEACDAALDAMCVAAGWPKGYRPEYDHAPFHTGISASEIGYYALRNGRAGSPFMS